LGRKGCLEEGECNPVDRGRGTEQGVGKHARPTLEGETLLSWGRTRGDAAFWYARSFGGGEVKRHSRVN